MGSARGVCIPVFWAVAGKNLPGMFSLTRLQRTLGGERAASDGDGDGDGDVKGPCGTDWG